MRYKFQVPDHYAQFSVCIKYSGTFFINPYYACVKRSVKYTQTPVNLSWDVSGQTVRICILTDVPHIKLWKGFMFLRKAASDIKEPAYETTCRIIYNQKDTGQTASNLSEQDLCCSMFR